VVAEKSVTPDSQQQQQQQPVHEPLAEPPSTAAVFQVGDVKMSVVRWYDNRAVTFLSTFVGAEALMTAKRWCKDEMKQVSCPKVVDTYNKHMGGVDLLDSLTGLYRGRIRSKKW